MIESIDKELAIGLDLVYKMADAAENFVKKTKAARSKEDNDAMLLIIADKLRDTLRVEILTFLTALIYCDGDVSEKELEFINRNFDLSFDEEKLMETHSHLEETIWDEGKVGKSGFLTSPPDVMRLFLYIDNEMFRRKKLNIEQAFSCELLLFYEAFCELFKQNQGSVNRKETSLINKYIKMLREYIDTNKAWDKEDIEKSSEEKGKMYISDSNGNEVLIRCAKCGSTDIDEALPGYDKGKGLLGLLLVGPLGLGIGIDNDAVSRVMCRNCGHIWDPRKIDIVVKRK